MQSQFAHVARWSAKIAPKFRAVFIMLLCCFCGTYVHAQLSFNATGTQTINFSTTVAGVNNGAFAGTGWTAIPGSGQLDSDAWEFLGWSDGNTTYGGTFTANDYARGTSAVAVTTGGTYAYTGAPGSVANPALMVQPATNDLTPGSITLRIQNTSASGVLNKIDIAYKLFCRNDEARASKFNLQWSSDNVNFADVPGGAYTSPGTADVLGWQQVFNPSVSITGFTVVPSGYFYIRWFTDDDPSTPSGSRDEFGLDDIAVTATFVSCSSPPSTAASINSITPITGSTATVNFTRGNGTGGMMAVVSPAPLSGNPVNGINYTENLNYGNGSVLANGWVVYFNNGITAGNSGSFTITGLNTGATYYVTLFEYNTSGPCYATPGTASSFTTSSSTNASATNYFRAKTSGNWALPSNWEFSTDGGLTYSALPCDLSPTYQSSGILIPSGKTMDITGTVTLDQTILEGTLRLNAGGILNVYDGAGNDLDIHSSGVFQVMTNTAYTSAVLYPSGTPQISVAGGGIIRIGNGGSVGSGYSGLASGASQPTVWSTGAIFDWNSSETFQTSNITYFNGTPAGTVPIFRISKTPSLIPGSTLTTVWNGVLEVNQPLTLRFLGSKYMRNGITGSSSLTLDASCGFIFVGDQSFAAVNASIKLPNIYFLNNTNASRLYIVSGCTASLDNNISVDHLAGLYGVDVQNGATLNCNTNVISGTSTFNLANLGTLITAHAQGISNLGLTGSIQVSGARFYGNNAHYKYNGSVNQVTGTGLPTTQASLTISNTGTAPNNTVTQTSATSSSPALNLVSGIFVIGSGQTYNVTGGGTCTVTAGDFATGAAGGTLNFTTGGTLTGTSNPYNLYVGNGGVSTPGSPDKVTIQAGGAFRINSGGWLNTVWPNSIYYASGSSLEYNSGGTYNSGNEWIQGASGSLSKGGPSNVSILASGTQLQLNAGGIQIMTGNLLVKTGTTFKLNTVAGRDFTIGGDWTREAGSFFTHNERKVTFNGTTDQTIMLMGGGVEYFSLLRIDKGSFTLKLAAAPNASSVLLSGSNGATNSLEFIRGNIDLQQNDFNFNINYSNSQTNNIQIDGQASNRTRNIISTGGPANFNCFNLDNSTSRLMVFSKPGTYGDVVFGPTVTLTTGGLNAGGIDFGLGSLVTVNGTFQLNSYGFTQNNPPNYGAGSYLIYNTGGMYRRNVEWQTSDPGVPYNVTLKANNTHVYLNTLMNGSASRTARASLRIYAGAILSMDGEGGNNYGDILTVTDSVYIAGTLELAHIFGGDMFVGKDWKRVTGGVFTDNLREVEFNGGASSLIEGPVNLTEKGETFSYLSINKSGAFYAQCNSPINVTRRLRIPGGSVKLDNNDITLKSAAVYTAYLDAVPAASSINYSGSGRFVVERFIATGTGGYPNHGKSWQLLAVPVNDAGGPAGQTVNQAWQEGQSPAVVGNSGLGTIITNKVIGSGGFDFVTGVGPSMKTYDPPTNTWVGISGTGIKHYNPNGYMIFVRGDRNAQAYNSVPTNTVLRTRGKVFAPNNVPASVTVPASPTLQLFQTVGNPYAAPIRFSLLGRTNLKNVFYVWDPRLTTGSAYGLGAFQTFSFDGTNYRVTPGGGSYGALNSVCDTIQSGQAFFVQASVVGGGTVSFSESAKAGGYRLVARSMHPQAGNGNKHFLGVRLFVDNQGTQELIDGTVSQFAHRFSNAVDNDDALKLENTGENFSIIRDGTLLASEKMDVPGNGDEIPFNLAGFRAMNYTLEIVPEQMQFPRLSAYLFDRWLNSYTPVDLNDTSRYNFTISASSAGSYAANRFSIVFRKGRVPQILPYLYSISQGEGQNLLVCTVKQVPSEGYFELLAENNGNIQAISRIDAEASLYAWKLPSGMEKAVFQVRYVSTENREWSNQLQNLPLGAGQAYRIFPNPVSNGQLQVALPPEEGIQDKSLIYSILDASGKLMQRGRVAVYGNQQLLRINLESSIPSGKYQVQLQREGMMLTRKSFILLRP